MQVLPDHPDYPHFLLWQEFARDFWDLGQAVLGISGFTESSPADQDSSLLENYGQEHCLHDLIGMLQMFNLNAATHLSALGSMPMHGHFLDLPTHSVSRIVLESGAKMDFIAAENISVEERMTRYFSIYHREMHENHRLGDGSNWMKISEEIKKRAAAVGASVNSVPPLAKLVELVGHGIDGKIYNALCGPVHSDSVAIRQLAMQVRGKSGGIALLEHDINPDMVNKVLWLTFQTFLSGYNAYLRYTGNLGNADEIARVERNFRAHAKSWRPKV